MAFLFHPILHASHLLEEALREALAPIDLQPRQARLVDALATLGPIQQRNLAARFSVAPASMSVMVARLVRVKLVRRDTGPNNIKDLFVTLTPSGQALVPAIHAAWIGVDAKLVAALGVTEADRFSQAGLFVRDYLGGRPPVSLTTEPKA